jgi:hypothetical protein
MRLVVALNLEGTLISNAISAFPRPGLKLFIENVLKTADRVVMFTTVPEDHARGLLQIIEGIVSYRPVSPLTWSLCHTQARRRIYQQ